MIAPRTRRRLVPVALVVLVLALVPALPAQAFPLDLTLHAHGLWWKVVDAFAQVWVKPEERRVPAGDSTKAGSSIDPLGTNTEAGGSIDPLGSSSNADSAVESAVPFTEAGSQIDPLG